MKMKWAFFAVLAVFFLRAVNPLAKAVNTTDIDQVLKKTVLDAQDFQVIDDFLSEAIQELVRTRDFTSIAQLRAVIVSKKSTQGQYAQRFSESAHRHIQAGFQQVQELRREERRTNVVINLLILIDSLQDLGLADLAMPWLKDQNMVVRYWAVHSLTNAAAVQQLNSGAASSSTLANTIVDRLKETVETGSPEILVQIARFAASVNVPQGEALLLQVADVRIKRYAEWTVKYEFYDVGILKLLESKLPLPSAGTGSIGSATGPAKPAIAQRFAQLYSYAIQRYIKGTERALLSEVQKRHLVSVLVEVEEKCIGRLLNRPQLTIRRAIERESMTALLDEHNRLLGAETTPGELPSKLGFDYGSNRTAPIPLPDPPKKP
ncbi:MAG: hypothetical protein ACYTAO_03040 [Planctomycetota bacterium]|jgi:hypothetical protein